MPPPWNVFLQKALHGRRRHATIDDSVRERVQPIGCAAVKEMCSVRRVAVSQLSWLSNVGGEQGSGEEAWERSAAGILAVRPVTCWNRHGDPSSRLTCRAVTVGCVCVCVLASAVLH